VAQPERTIGEALLDQRNLAGIGTMYRAETLFLRGVNPHTPVGSVPELDRLVDLAHRLLMAGRGLPGPGERCRRCGTPIERGTQGPPGEDRVIYWRST
jgi:endonuclease-8